MKRAVSERDEGAHLQGRPGGFYPGTLRPFRASVLNALPVPWLFVLAGYQFSRASKKHPRLPAQPWGCVLAGHVVQCLGEGTEALFPLWGRCFKNLFGVFLWALPVAFQANTPLSALTSILLKRP